MSRVASAFSVTWIDVGGGGDVVVCLRSAGDTVSQIVPIRHELGAKTNTNIIVEPGKWNEELLPEEGIHDLHDHANESVCDVLAVLMGELDVSNSRLELRKILFNNEIGISS